MAHLIEWSSKWFSESREGFLWWGENFESGWGWKMRENECRRHFDARTARSLVRANEFSCHFSPRKDVLGFRSSPSVFPPKNLTTLVSLWTSDCWKSLRFRSREKCSEITCSLWIKKKRFSLWITWSLIKAEKWWLNCIIIKDAVQWKQQVISWLTAEQKFLFH